MPTAFSGHDPLKGLAPPTATPREESRGPCSLDAAPPPAWPLPLQASPRLLRPPVPGSSVVCPCWGQHPARPTSRHSPQAWMPCSGQQVRSGASSPRGGRRQGRGLLTLLQVLSPERPHQRVLEGPILVPLWGPFPSCPFMTLTSVLAFQPPGPRSASNWWRAPAEVPKGHSLLRSLPGQP